MRGDSLIPESTELEIVREKNYIFGRLLIL